MAKYIIRFYQIFDLAKHRILFTVFGFSSVCRHRPTCSRYTEIQIKEHGTIVGSMKGLARILTCW
jgi:putative component of membrane protein insertase Oxa1/YidC/SpoIIIJ protein YidD